jgi:hypothetical protein
MPTTRKKQKKHRVQGDLHIRELTRAGTSLTLIIKNRNGKLGELVIGRGALLWYGRKRQRRKRINWTKFAEMMDRLAYGRM